MGFLYKVTMETRNLKYFFHPPLSPEGKIIEHDGSLRIPSVRSQDEGKYQCVATNLAGNSSLTLTLSVLGE